MLQYGMLCIFAILLHAVVTQAGASEHSAIHDERLQTTMLDRSLQAWNFDPTDMQNTMHGKQPIVPMQHLETAVRPAMVSQPPSLIRPFRLARLPRTEVRRRPQQRAGSIMAAASENGEKKPGFDEDFGEWFEGVGMGDRSEFFLRRQKLKEMGLNTSEEELDLGVRIAEPADAQQIANLINLDGRQVPPGLDKEAFITATQAESWMGDITREQGEYRFLVAEDMSKRDKGGRMLVGCVRVYMPFLPEPTEGTPTFQAGFDVLAVIPEYDNRGIRGLMVNQAESLFIQAATKLLPKASFTGRTQALRIIVSGIPASQVLATAAWERKATIAFYRNSGYSPLQLKQKNFWEVLVGDGGADKLFFKDVDVGVFGKPISTSEDFVVT